MYSRKNKLISNRVGIPLLLLLMTVATIWRFGASMPSVFFGDDLANLLAFKNGEFASSLYQSLSASYLEKYRPVFAIAIHVLFEIFEGSIQPYLLVNAVTNGLGATLAFVIAHRLSGGRIFPSLIIAIIVATSRFSLYQVTQVTGILEGLAFTLLLAMIYSLIRAEENEESTWRWGWLAIAFSFLVIHTHERYIVVAPWLSLAFAMMPGIWLLSKARVIALLSAPLAIVAFNVIYKVVVLKLPFFVGTGGAQISISTQQVLEQIDQAALSIVGFNSGPEYLIGVKTESLEWMPAHLFAWILISVWSLCFLAAMIATVVTASKRHTGIWKSLYWPLLLSVLALILLAPPLLTIRLEQRWLLEPFVLLVLLFAWSCNTSQYRIYVPVFIPSLLLGIASIGLDSLISPYFKQIFFVSAGHFASAVKAQVIDTNGKNKFPIGLLADPGSCNWTLQSDHFFLFYSAGKGKFYCFGTTDDALATKLPSNIHVFGIVGSPLRFGDVTSEWNALVQSHSQKIEFDFIEAFSTGHINNPSPFKSSPSGQGVGVMHWNTVLGLRSTITIITGFSYRYDAIPINEASQLKFDVGLIYPSHQPARAIVLATGERISPTVLYSQDLPSPSSRDKLHLQPATISLSQFAGENISLIFLVKSPGGDSTGHWVAFADPRIVTSTIATP